MDYAGWITGVCAILEYQVADASSASPTTDDDFNNIIPRAIEYTENRLQTDLDFIATMATSSGALTMNQRLTLLPTTPTSEYAGTFIVASQIKLVIGGLEQPPLEPVTRDFLEYAWPSDTSLGVPPVQWCPVDQANILVGPAPDQAYAYKVTGTQRFVQLSSVNTSNFLTAEVPDLYFAASMVFFSGYQRDYGAESEDPKLAQSWENQYQTRLKSNTVEEARKRYSNMFPSPSKPTALTAQG